MISNVEQLQITEAVNLSINELTSKATNLEIDTLYNEGYALTKEDVYHLTLELRQDVINMLIKSN